MVTMKIAHTARSSLSSRLMGATRRNAAIVLALVAGCQPSEPSPRAPGPASSSAVTSQAVSTGSASPSPSPEAPPEPLHVMIRSPRHLTVAVTNDFAVLALARILPFHRLDAAGLREDASLAAGLDLKRLGEPSQYAQPAHFAGEIRFEAQGGALAVLRHVEHELSDVYLWRTGGWTRVASPRLDTKLVAGGSAATAELTWWHDDVELVRLPHGADQHAAGWYVESDQGFRSLSRTGKVCDYPALGAATKSFVEGPLFILGEACQGEQVMVERIERATLKVTAFAFPGAVDADASSAGRFVGDRPDDLYAVLRLVADGSQRPYLAHFDGRQWTNLRFPRVDDWDTQLFVAPDATLWVTTGADGNVWRGVRKTSGTTWTKTNGPPPYGPIQFTPDGGVWRVGQEVGRYEHGHWRRFAMPAVDDAPIEAHRVFMVKGIEGPLVLASTGPDDSLVAADWVVLGAKKPEKVYELKLP